MKRILLIILALLILFISPMMADANQTKRSQELVRKNCASCHTLEMPHPSTISSLPAPPMNAVIFHIKAEMKRYEEQKAFIVNYALHPQPKLSVCDMTKVEKFGVMPSLKGKISTDNLQLIAQNLLANFPSNQFVKLRAEAKLYKKINTLRNAPFLMNQSALPQITKLLMQNWGKGKLGLNETQKERLLNIRKRVIQGIKEIKKKLYVVERNIIEGTIDSEDIKYIEAQVKVAAKLKAQATMIQIRCIIESVEILNEEQMAFLVPFWGM